MSQAIRKFLYRFTWDTRCRNLDVSGVLKPYLVRRPTILDAGCGEHGVAAFIAGSEVVGVDVLPTDVRVEGFSFVHGSILDLPFGDRSFEIAVSVDVLEHLPAELREKAIGEVTRCAERAAVLTFPSGKLARAIDEAYHDQLVSGGDEVPDWLTEHLSSDYPEVAEVTLYLQRAAKRCGRAVRISVTYSESVSVAKFLRRLPLRSKYLYLAGNLLSGLLMPVMPGADRENGYRAVVLAEFDDE